jgi:TRAP-type C4-dicarboxylate transport system permease small subunit
MADWEGGRYAAEENPLPRGFFASIESFEQILMNVSFVILLGALSWGVLSRYVVPTPATWVEEITSISFAWLIFVGAAEVHRRKQHVSVDLLTNLLPPSLQRLLALLVEVFVAGLCFYVAYLGVRQTIVMHTSMTSLLRIPLSIAYTGFTLGIFLVGVRGLQRVVRTLREWARA